MKRIIALTLAVIMIFAFTVSVAAESNLSPTGKQYYKIETSSEGGGQVSASTNKVQKNTDGSVKLTAIETTGKFIRWAITGDYSIKDGGTLEDKVLTIVPSSDIKAVAKFSGSGGSGNNGSSTSPKTGDPLYAVIPFMAIALAAAFISMKKLKKN